MVIVSVRIVGWTNSLAVGVELAIVVLLGIALVVAVLLTGDAPRTPSSRRHRRRRPPLLRIGGGWPPR